MYEEFYHLKAKPFRLSPDPEFFFASRGHKRALAYLRYGLMQDEGFVVITGAPGTGKTTLAQILLQEMDQSELVVAQLTTSQLDPDELLRMVAASFGLRYDGVDKAGLLKTMEAFLIARAREKKRALLVVDEAQNLPPKSLEELRMLSNLMIGGKALLQTFLLGQPQFRNMLDDPDLEQLRQRVIANYHLSELAQDECQSYIETRLQHVGWQGDPKITAAAYDGIYQYTQGVPRRINMLCDRLMLFGCLEERHEIDNSVLRDVSDELQQEISGKPIKRESLAEDEVKPKNAKFDPLTGLLVTEQTPEAGQDEKQSLEEYFGTDFSDNENVVEELETKDQNSAYSDIEDAAQEDEESDENNSELAVQVDEILNVENSGAAIQGSVQQQGAQENNAQQDIVSQNNNQRNIKDRFLVIPGGRDGTQADSGGTSSIVTSTSTQGISARPINNSDSSEVSSVQASSGDSDEVILRKILRLVLAYHRSPRSFPGLDDSTQLLPNGIKQILTLAVSDDETLKNLRQISVMGISPSMLRAAVRFFVRRVMFLPGGDDYRVLGLPSSASRLQIEEHYGLLMRLMRQEKKGADETGVTGIGESYERLCQSEITHIPDAEPEDMLDEDISELDDLDLDLAPNIQGYDTKTKNVITDSNNLPDVIAGDQRTGPIGRNVVLVIGVVVVVFTLYLTQISSTVENPESDNATLGQTQQLAMMDQQDSEAPSGMAESTVDITESADVTTTETIVAAEEDNSEAEEASRQRILEELRAEADVREKARRDAEAIERAKLEAELKKAAQALATAEAKGQQEAQARIKAEAAVKKAIQAKTAAEAKAKAAALKAKKDQAIAQAKARAKAEASAKAAAKKKVAVVIQAPAKPKPVNNRNRELQVLISTLEKTYAAGDLDGFSSVFATSARTGDQTDLTGIRSDYKSLFENTSSRKLTLSNLDWKLDNNYARGVGVYEVVSRSKGASQGIKSKGKVTLQLEGGSGKQLLITRFYFSESQSSKVDAPRARASVGELNQTLENFSSAYKEGNIEQFMVLFSPDASTNDRSTLQGIRGDYVDLFSGTESRRLDYSSMQWQWKGDIANGIGTYVVTVRSNGNDNNDIYRGKLRFSVKQYGDKLLISKFVFE